MAGEDSERRPLLRFITCGSVDDGKSTLIGRLLHEAGQVPEDVVDGVRRATRPEAAQGEALDYALFTDGLAAEREQGITIDVAYRPFETSARRFIVADTPGHEQYTRNMVTGASTAAAAVILVDVRQGVLAQTRRHACIVALLGIRSVALAVNKMDLVAYDEAAFRQVSEAFAMHAAALGLQPVMAIPLSALRGDNVLAPSDRMPWYAGPPLLRWLEAVEVATEAEGPWRFPVQWVNRAGPDFRGYAGTVARGLVRVGDRLRVQPSGVHTTVARIVTAGGDLAQAAAGQAVTLVLSEPCDVARGDVLAEAAEPAEQADQFEATLVWMGEAPLVPGRRYLMRQGTATLQASVGALHHRLDVGTLQQLAASTLQLNEVGRCRLDTSSPIAFEPYEQCRALGGFILIDAATKDTVAAGMLHRAARHARDIHWQAMQVDKAARAAQKRQTPTVVWFTGLSGAGKSTLANLLEQRLHALGCHTYLLDGDNVRHGLCRDLGFGDADRVENIRRVAEVAKLMADAGLIVLAAFISPFRAERDMARALLAAGEFVEVHVDAPLEVAEGRDVKGLYKKARRGELKNFTGLDAPYEPPLAPELHLRTDQCTPDEAVARIVGWLQAQGRLVALTSSGPT
ncbi:adenylyl-sulfate kinase [Piscinibacter sakaiensis]|uniref:Adenylyl-sulfate kinase n=1 Tax=Piscinibacter sakaiensis TaxID=1547922 RepID=A0A0K8P8I4_PISS1|nr:adenylyl-sulfate kinase [Piscinibacter sakaiensis]GAP38952.1 sulfate adenylyltransferase, subunit 1/adenylylsulfate kinase [Piscinibacter sakaiensis]